MDDPALRSRSGFLTSVSEDYSSGELYSPAQSKGERIGTGVILCLAGLGIAAAVTTVVVFGTGYLLLTQEPAETARSQSKAAMAATDSSAPSTGSAAVLPAFPAGNHEPARSPLAERAAAPSGPASNPPGRSPVATAAPGKTASGAVQPTPAPGIHADAGASAAASPATSGPAASESASSRPGEGAANTTAQPAPGTSLPMAEINALLAQGDDAFRRGDLASARLLYQRAYEANDGRGALGIGASYDPVFLRRYHIWTELPDLDEARTWYQRARSLGAQDAQTRLKRLNNAPR